MVRFPPVWLRYVSFAVLLAKPEQRVCGDDLPPPSDVVLTRNVDPGPDVVEVRAVNQNWSDAESNSFYNAPQGSQILPYDWFLHLEQPDHERRFREADHIRSLGYLPRNPGPGNPDGLPIGYIKDASYRDGTPALGLTCAACHTTQINAVNGDHTVGFLIDGAPTLGDFETMQRRLVAALDATLNQPEKFDRFAASLLSVPTPPAKEFLRSQLRSVLGKRATYNQRNLPAAGAAPFGPGRVDAFGAILNQVTTEFIGIDANHRHSTAPVSYPFLWDAPQHDFVQWNGAAENNTTSNPLIQAVLGTSEIGALGRNAGEVLGVFGDADLTEESGFLGGYRSSVNHESLIDIENSLKTLWSPLWPAELGPIDDAMKTRGKTVFQNHCQSCHRNHQLRRDDPERTVKAIMVAVGTDDTMARNFATRIAQTGLISGRRKGLWIDFTSPPLGTSEMVGKVLTHVVRRVVVGPTTQVNALSDVDSAELAFTLAPQLQIETEDAALIGPVETLTTANGDVTVSGDAFEVFRKSAPLDRFQLKSNAQGTQFLNAAGATFLPRQMSIAPRVSNQPESTHRIRLTNATVRYPYKARPLNGIWASAPYLHNGSVPNLWELLKPVEAPNETQRRVRTFFVGSREFDAVNVGFNIQAGPFEFDTSLPGNANRGHEFGVDLTESQKWDLIEYLKSL